MCMHNSNMYCFLLSLSVANSDYRPRSYTVQFGPDSTQQSISVVIEDDNVVEEQESFSCTLSISSELEELGFAVDPSAASASISITDNDGMQPARTCTYIGLVV